jgi:CheY-like chemotaxis protein
VACKGTVLVVDDDPHLVAFLMAALEEEGCQVLSAVDGAALQLAHERPPDLILLDIMMPIMDGVEVSCRLRADPVTAQIPIIIMSARHRLAVLGPRLSVNDQLAKPFDLTALYTTVARWMPAA